MPDHATSTHAAVQAQLDRLTLLSPGRDILGLERITELCARLGNPQDRLPPVFHVAGTNGKGSTCAFLRAAIEAAGMSCHVYTSPHLVRFNERIRIAGKLIEDDALAALLAEVLDHAEGLQASFFEVTTAAAFLAFSRSAADACIVEVGLGGRLDATNIIARPAACGIASLGIDHEAFLLSEDADAPSGLSPIERIAWEKAGIAKEGVPLLVASNPEEAVLVIREVARQKGAHYLPAGRKWNGWGVRDGKGGVGGMRYRDNSARLDLPPAKSEGHFQSWNAGLAFAMLRHQRVLTVPLEALEASLQNVTWPGRLQLMAQGPLTRLLPEGALLYLDGGHNVAAAKEISQWIGKRGHVNLVMGMLSNKDAEAFISVLKDQILHFCAVPINAHDCWPPAQLAAFAWDAGATTAFAFDSVENALRYINDVVPHETDVPSEPDDRLTLICGSLYLAGEVLDANDQRPE